MKEPKVPLRTIQKGLRNEEQQCYFDATSSLSHRDSSDPAESTIPRNNIGSFAEPFLFSGTFADKVID